MLLSATYTGHTLKVFFALQIRYNLFSLYRMACNNHTTGNCVMSGPDDATPFAKVKRLDPSYVGNGRAAKDGSMNTDHILNTGRSYVPFPRRRTLWAGEIGWKVESPSSYDRRMLKSAHQIRTPDDSFRAEVQHKVLNNGVY